jgi:hypothetical protein
MDGEPILKKTLLTVAVMVGCAIAFVGTISIVAVVVTSHAVGGSDAAGSGAEKAALTDPPGLRAPGTPGAKGRSPSGTSRQGI